jgi:uncharacterized protein YndB with AHSA1/START domain
MSDTTLATSDKATRRFDMTLDINATPEDVWRALTDAGELMRWFPLQARVKPGKGGSIFWGWDEHWAWESQIDTWEPSRRLRLVENRPAFDANGQPLPEPAHQLAMEFTLETHAGRTRLRLVHSGFGKGASWDDELDSISAGWQFELRGLKHYLERHRGRDRHYAFAQKVTSLDRNAVWDRLLSPAAFDVISGTLAQGERCVIKASTGDELSGVIAWHKPGADVFMIVSDLDDGVFRISTWRAADQTGVQVWMTSWDPRQRDRIHAFGARVRALFDGVFA